MVRTAGVPNITEADKILVVKAVKQILPLGGSEWELVAAVYNQLHRVAAEKDGRAVVQRPYPSLKRIFEDLSTKKKPTGKRNIYLKN